MAHIRIRRVLLEALGKSLETKPKMSTTKIVPCEYQNHNLYFPYLPCPVCHQGGEDERSADGELVFQPPAKLKKREARKRFGNAVVKFLSCLSELCAASLQYLAAKIESIS
jgi:hypothetical protein